MAVDIDAVFKEIGEFGPYQRRIYFLLCLPTIFVGASNFAQVFIAATPKYRCVVPQCDPNIINPSYNQPFLNFTIPYITKDESWDECHRYQRLNTQHSCLPEDYSQNATEGCPEGKVFSTDIYLSTLVSEYNLTCNAAWEAEMSQTIYFSGIMAGSFIFGIVGDKIGRKMSLVIAVLCMAVSGTVCALVTGLSVVFFFRFINAMMANGLFQSSILLGMELVGPNMKVLCGIIIELFYSLGEMFLALISWWLRDWRMIQLVISAPVSCFVFYCWIIPESPRWLQAQGKHQKVRTVLEKIARKNNEIVPAPERVENISNEAENITVTREIDVSTKLTLLDVMKSPLLCVRILSMFFIWAVVAVVFYGLSLNATLFSTGKEDFGPFVEFVFSALMEIPGYILAWLGMSYWGRRNSLALSMTLAGVLCTGAGFSQEYDTQYLLILTLLGKCFITCAFGIIFVYTSEICPTSVRSTVLGLSSTFARIGSMLAPFSKELALMYGPLPLLLFGMLALVGAAMNLVMPETLKTELPDTLEEANNLGRAEVVQPPVIIEEEEQCLLSED